MNKLLTAVILSALAGSANAAGFDPKASASDKLINAAGFDPMASASDKLIKEFVGTYSLSNTIKGECKKDGIFVKLAAYSNSACNKYKNEGNNVDCKRDLSINGLPENSGQVIVQALDINSGAQTDKNENPMNDHVWYTNREAVLSDNTLKVRNSGEESLFFRGEIVIAKKSSLGLEIQTGTYIGNSVKIKTNCAYEKIGD